MIQLKGVGRAPIRKLGPQDRLIRPALEAKKRAFLTPTWQRLSPMRFYFDPQEDKEAMKLQANIHEYGIEYVLRRG